MGDIGGDVVSAVVSVWPFHRSMEKRNSVCAYELLLISRFIVVSFVRELHLSAICRTASFGALVRVMVSHIVRSCS